MKWTLKKGSVEFDVHTDTLAKRLRAAGFNIGKGQRYTTLQIMEALFGDLEKERIRLTRAQADVAEVDRQETLEALVPKEVERASLASVLVPLRSQLLAMSAAVSPVCDTPEAAAKAISAEVHRILASISAYVKP